MATGRLPAIPSVREIIKLYGLSARSELSQNFLLDHNLTERIARAAGVDGAVVIEVGAGPGPLTRSILECGARHLIAVEKDRRFRDALETVALSPASGGRLRVLIADMFDVQEDEVLNAVPVPPVAWEAPSTPVRLVGNLPFNVGTQLLLKWLRQRHTRTGLYRSHGRVPLTLLLQKEVAERMVATPGSKVFSRLSVAVQQGCDARILFGIRGGVFVPQAAVDTAVVQVTPRVDQLLSPTVPVWLLEHMCALVFGRRRKMMRLAVQTLGPDAVSLLPAAGIEPTVRPEQVAVAAWCRLAEAWHRALPPAAVQAMGARLKAARILDDMRD